MLSSISPVGEAARGQRWGITVAAHLSASAIAGALLGAALGGLGAALATVTPVDARVAVAVLALAAATGLLLDAAGRVPSLHRQVDERWLSTYRGWVYGAGFGAQLGVGVVTIIPRSITLVAWLAALLTASPVQGALVGVVFGGVRGAGILLGGAARSVAALRGLLRRVDRARRPVDLASRMGQAGLVVAAAVAALR